MTRSPDTAPTLAPAGARGLLALRDGWFAAATPPGARALARDLDELDWLEASVPGTAAGALRDAGRLRSSRDNDFDAQDWWFRTSFEAEPAAPGERLLLRLDGIATIAEVYLNGELLLRSESMFSRHAIDVGARVREVNELAICCRALAPLLGARRRPRARWRSSLGVDGNLRFFRTMLLGRAPGLSPGPAIVGPWRGVTLERRRGLHCAQLQLRSRCEGSTGVLSVNAQLDSLDGRALERAHLTLDGPSGKHAAMLELSADAEHGTLASGSLLVPDAARWWPHTHGEPALHTVELTLERTDEEPLRLPAGRVGFRELAAGSSPAHDPRRDGLDLHVNGVRTFVRGAVWTPCDPVAMTSSAGELRATLVRARDAGMNMLRIPGTTAYESAEFHDLCDELGIMLWQDFMFANFDYPIADEGFRRTVEDEARAVLAAGAQRPSLAVLCGNSEVEQQIGMLGLDPALARGELFDEILPGLAAAAAVDAIYLPSAPCGGTLPFRPDVGVANYFGVGAYQRPLEDARRAGVRFASECLAFANVPRARADRAPASEIQELVAPRDAGAGWDHNEIRDHYLQSILAHDAGELRRVDPERYLALSRALTGEIMAEVFGEWRRAGSPCGGGLVLWLRDVAPGAGWGVLDHEGKPKPAYHFLRRALAPVAVWSIDEGLGGVIAHVANDRPAPLECELRLALYSGGELLVGEANVPISVAAHSSAEWDVEALLGRFVDVSWAYRFGPPAQDAIVLSLAAPGTHAAPISQSVRFPAGRPLRREAIDRIGLRARVAGTSVGTETGTDDDGVAKRLLLHTDRLAYGVSIDVPGYAPDDDWLTLEPGAERIVTLHPLERRGDSDDRGGASEARAGTLEALNMRGRVSFELGGER